MNKKIKHEYQISMRSAMEAEQVNDLDNAFKSLERAHILGQRYFIPHIATHWQMLRIGLKRNDNREVIGQIVRLIATVPGFIFGWVPRGNPGGANISALKPVPLPADLQPLLADSPIWRDVLIRLTIYAVIVLIVLA
ncbi:DUF3703 domain-containing protein [Marinomonas sp. UCMA 3892]|jgi:hypothetical protein|uniref:DUF3703 domain-containing protein n=6 Tax=Gammaproteobacteria TaxID=1236 RepID=A0A1E7Q757_9GAMM|nr:MULTISPECIES: DUF3703 domain-containing protein [Gammaproteobacteria]MBU1308721.1 DUF3703 domain-containing protein [Gammaproteobacteria bacterium]MDP5036350.1 DUF3703 domain-containing protein [Alishewanella sp.]MDP5206735.1 DUF3703 domain-containing protein [Alishewanella sp. SMS9]PKM18749.1 MAG: DUF3703 domain-containing protein [Gammaproteobacteria bacterium HGW-Gammaproteobacteria-15]ABM24007.1 conserved hypothetical protein [Shewanella sp. W3-18-1]|tara:strand:- start:7820 stop:8230 length:411 start_codon:yes stop_codon:yes gene_type:complete